MNLFFLVPARDGKHVHHKIEELKDMNVPFTIICGENVSSPAIIHRKPRGKYDAINYGSELVNDNTEIVCLNDVDTTIYNFERALSLFNNQNVDLVFCKVIVTNGPQPHFYRLLDAIRRRIPIAASGELMLIRREVFQAILPLPPCKAEDTYILFKTLELGRKPVFCEECWVKTERTRMLGEEIGYKKRTVSGIYQALSYAKSPWIVRLFYVILPFLAPLLALYGEKGFCWIKGIFSGMAAFLSKDHEVIF